MSGERDSERSVSQTAGIGPRPDGTETNTLLRVGEAATLLSVSRWTIYRWVEDGRLHGMKLGKKSLRIFRESVTGLIKRNETAMSATPSDVTRPAH